MNKVNWQERLDQILSTGKNKSYFTAGVTILFIVIMSLIGIVPAISALGAQAEDNAKRDQILADLNKKRADLQNLTITQYSESETIEYFNNIIPDQEHQEEIINLLNDLAVSNSVSISSFSFDRENLTLNNEALTLFGERVKPMPLSISIQGQRDGLLSFANEVESSARILNVDDYIFNRAELTPSGNINESRYTLGLRLITYYYE